jgi:tetratricopeptide (TPR) repeat protein
MNADQFRRLEALYDAAAAVDPAERSQFVAERCADDDELRRELMAAFNDTGSGMTAAVHHAASTAIEAEATGAGRRMGPYRIIRALGRGGMGAVYLAVRDDDQFHKEVAIKTLKFDLESGPAVARFRHERQILAHLEHPNIARLLDGGTTELGTPYIVLEYVAGVQIGEWCERQQLSIDGRLRLFLQVCDAVQYAHQHLIVHRDIKPGNILVTSDGVPKLLDFGIAKLLDAGALAGFETRGVTATGALLMTPDYVSPEQVRGEAVSTATDVYSLGAVLYELLTGQRPHALHTYNAVEIARVVCETEIRPPSTLGSRRLRGDLDTIVLKAMQKNAARRYASAAELGEDVRRHLEGLPIAARADTSLYRTTKFLRRHWIGVAATAAIILSLAIGVAVAIQEARVAQRRFAQVRELANTFLFQFYDQVSPLAGSTAVRASIVETARKYLDGLSNDAGNDTDLLVELAQAYGRLGDVQGHAGTANLGQLNDARRSYQRALDLYGRIPITERSPLDQRLKLARVLGVWGWLEYNAAQTSAAETLTRRSLALIADRNPDGATRRLRASDESSLGNIRLKQGNAAEAIGLFESALRTISELQASGFADSSLPTAHDITQERLARAKVFNGDLDGALSDFNQLLQNSAACDERAAAAACRNLGYRLSWAGDVYAAVDRPNLNEPEKGAALYEQAVRIEERLVAIDPQDDGARFDLSNRYGKLADALWSTQPERAYELHKRSLDVAQGLASKEQLRIIDDAFYIASSKPLIRLGRTADARRTLTEALKRVKTNPQSPYDDQLTEIHVRTLWASLLVAEGDRAAAAATLNEVIRDTDALRAAHTADLTPIYYLSVEYRLLASMTSGQERRDALLKSAAAWHSWPATSFTRREEQRDVTASK